MATPASGFSATITPSQTVTITIQNGVVTPSQDPVTIPFGGSVQFVNNVAGQDYALQLFTNDNQKHVVAQVYLAAGGSAILVSDSDSSSKGKKCFYNIEDYPPTAADKGGISDTTSGGHSIIIGSTPDDDK